MSGHDPLDTVRSGVETLRRSSVAAPPPPAAMPAAPDSDTETAAVGTPSTAAADHDTAASADTAGRAQEAAPSTRPDTPASKGASRGATRVRRRDDKATGRSDTATGDSDELPGFARGARRQIGVGLTEATFEALRAARSNQLSNGDVVLEALRRTHSELVAEFAPDDDSGDGLFPVEPRRKRRLGIEGVRRMEFMCSPAEAAVIGELAKRCDLSLSALIEEALTRHLGANDSTV